MEESRRPRGRDEVAADRDGVLWAYRAFASSVWAARRLGAPVAPRYTPEVRGACNGAEVVRTLRHLGAEPGPNDCTFRYYANLIESRAEGLVLALEDEAACREQERVEER